MRTIMLLGGSFQQVVAISVAKGLGYRTVLCDYLNDNPGQYVADAYYCISTTSFEDVLAVAVREKIDGIIAYASDPAAPTAAYVAEKLGLSTNPYASVSILCNKGLFREFLSTHNFNAPKAICVSESAEIGAYLTDLEYPMIIKPVDSSGSKGVSIVEKYDDIPTKIDFALRFSRKKEVILEHYVEKKHEYLIGGDVFIYKGKVAKWGLMNCHRDNECNKLVPSGKSYPPLIPDEYLTKVKKEIERLVQELGFEYGSMNVEAVVDKNDKVWLLDVGPRAGGNMIPDLMGKIWNINFVEMNIKCAMGDTINMSDETPKCFYATYNIHSRIDGVLKGINLSEEIQDNTIDIIQYISVGENVRKYDNSAYIIGILFLKFKSYDEYTNKIERLNDLVTVDVEDKS